MTEPENPTPGEPTPGRQGAAVKIAAADQKRNLLALPGLAAISLYLLVLGGVIIIGVVGRHYPPLFLAVAAAFLAASGGLILLLRWAWALAVSATLLLACYNIWIFTMQHMGPGIVQGLLNLVFFLYLIRPDVRAKLR